MTPFGARVRELRAARKLSLQHMAATLGVTSTYLSALEHGRRGKPTFVLMQGIIHALGIIWDEADELIRLADMSDPRVTIDTARLEPQATLLANRLAREIAAMPPEKLARLLAVLDDAPSSVNLPLVDLTPR